LLSVAVLAAVLVVPALSYLLWLTQHDSWQGSADNQAPQL
jgi:hypothetical protein